MLFEDRMDSTINKYGGLRQLARASGVSESCLCRYRGGKSLPDFVSLVRLFNVGVDINWLIAGRSSPRKVRL